MREVKIKAPVGPVSGHNPEEPDSMCDVLKSSKPSRRTLATDWRGFDVTGPVEHGRKLGRSLGFPTANVALPSRRPAPLGVYATWTTLPDGRRLPGVATIGTTPTVGRVAPRLEVWLFDFDENLYGQVITTELAQFLRPEAAFDSVEALTAQMQVDALHAAEALGVGRTPPDSGSQAPATRLRLNATSTGQGTSA